MRAACALIAIAGWGCADRGPSRTEVDAGYDPRAAARAAGDVVNPTPQVPAACYADTGGRRNGCATCHTTGDGRFDDSELQDQLSFAADAPDNPWQNLFVDRRAEVAAIDDATIVAWIRTDNYGPLRSALAGLGPDYPGVRPDLDLTRGFDPAGFARDGSRWRAVRYQPFPVIGWPTNGSYGDVFVRLPASFAADRGGAPAPAIERVNYALLEAALTAAPAPAAIDREVEPIDERVLGIDLDGDGRLGAATRIVNLPARYAGGAAAIAIVRGRVPVGVEVLHTVRYLDPDAPGGAARRLKELRYARKVEGLDDWAQSRAYDAVADERSEGKPPSPQGSPEAGYYNGFGWQLQAFIEDRDGRLRLQTAEEHGACLGCHGALGITIDHTFALARKVPGADGWRPQDLRGLRDRPTAGTDAPEVAAYLRRVGAGDDLGANAELLGRWFVDGQLDEAALARAAVGGDRDLAWVLSPSRARALALDKAYLTIVRAQSFARGRDATLAPVADVHRRVGGERTGLAEAGRVDRTTSLRVRW